MNNVQLKENKYFYEIVTGIAGVKAIFTRRNLDVGFHNIPPLQMQGNRETILSLLGLKLGQLVFPQQVHEDKIYIAEDKDKGRGAFNFEEAISSTDALVATQKNIVISVLTADCLPVFVIDKKKSVIAIVHAGWKSTQKDISGKTIKLLQDSFKSNSRDINVYFGPAMRSCCYEVGEEFRTYFSYGLERKNGKLYLDLIEVNRRQLKEKGVLEENIFDSGLCTYCQNNYLFSYRKEGSSCGRQMSFMVMG